MNGIFLQLDIWLAKYYTLAKPFCQTFYIQEERERGKKQNRKEYANTKIIQLQQSGRKQVKNKGRKWIK